MDYLFKITFYFLLLISSASVYSQTNFQKFYGGSGDDLGQTVDTTYDGGFILGGVTNTSGEGSYDFFLMKLDSAGNIEWQKTYGGTSTEESLDHMCVRQTLDSGYIFSGRTDGFGANGWDGYVAKTDKNGNLDWDKVYGSGASNENFKHIELTIDSGFIISGSDNTSGFGGSDELLVKLDANGNEQWKKIYGGGAHDHSGKPVEIKSGGYYVNGQSQTFGPGSRSTYIKQLDASGNILWEQFYGGSNVEGGIDLEITPDGGLLSLAFTSSFGAGNFDYFLLKTDSIGNLQWAKTYGGSGEDRPSTLEILPDNSGYLIYGYTESFGAGSRDVLVIKTDLLGNVIWSKTFGKANFDGNARNSAQSLELTRDGGFVLTGYSDSINIGGPNDVFLVKSDANGSALCNDVTVTVTSPTVSTSGPASNTSTVGNIINAGAIENNLAFVDTPICFCDNIVITCPKVYRCEDAVFIPNIFSPNSDGENDVLYARGIDYTLEVFRIFDRWGNKVFETTDPSIGWDGKHNGTLANSGVFAFYIEATCHLTGETIYIQGNVTLIR